MHSCPCCHRTLLRHICRNEVYWYCPSCRQEMPDFWPKLAIVTCPLGQENLLRFGPERDVKEVFAN